MMSPNSRRICIILSHDAWGTCFDRRILHQADILADEGYSVFIACFRAKTIRKSAPKTQAQNGPIEVLNRRSYRLILCDYADCAELPPLALPVPSFRPSALRIHICRLLLGPLTIIKALFPGSQYVAKLIQNIATTISSPLVFDLPLLQAVLDACSSNDLDLKVPTPSLIVACDTTTARAGYILKAIYSCRLWLDMHEYYSRQRAFSLYAQRYISCVEKFVCKYADRIYTVNPMLADRISSDLGQPVFSLQNYAVPSSPLAFDVPHLLSTAERSPLNIVFHGGAGPFRNIHNLVNAFICMPPDVALLTMFQQGISPSLLRAARRVPHISIKSYFHDHLLDYFLSCADAIIIPYAGIDVNTTLCSPNKLGDAIALGKPVLFNSQLLYLRSLSSRYPSLIPVNCTSPQALRSSIVAAIPLVHKLTLAQKRAIYDDLGAPAQSEIFRQWVRQTL